MNGLVRVSAVVPSVHLGNVRANVAEHKKWLEDAKSDHSVLVVFPELSLTGYSCGDLFFQKSLIEAAWEGVLELTKICPSGMAAVVGAPVQTESGLVNAAIVLTEGKVCGIVPKTYLPNTNEFYEKRWFESSSEPAVFTTADGVRFGVEICEDLWSPLPPSTLLSLAGCDIIVNLSASNELIAKREYRRDLVRQTSARCLCGYLYVSAGCGESSSDLIFSGHSMAAVCGSMLKENEEHIAEGYRMSCDIDVERIRADRNKSSSFRDAQYFWRSQTDGFKRETIENVRFYNDEIKEVMLNVPKHPFIPSDEREREMRCEQIFTMQAAALGRRLKVTGGKVVVGISGGLDSTLALLAACKAVDRLKLPRENILGITLPCFGTSDRTHDNAWALMKALGISAKEINIEAAVRQHLKDIEHDETDHSVAYENAQARERTQVLMDVANDFGGIVLGTGDLSEIALGWCTYNADHMSMYGVNSGVPKTLVRWIIRTAAELPEFAAAREVLLDILDTPISPELLPPDAEGKISQQTEDLVGPYELHDFFLYYMIRFGYSPAKIYELCRIAFSGDYDDAVILKWLKNFYRRFFSQQFKRNCMPDGVKVGSIALSPRGDWRMPSDAERDLWLSECEKIG